MEISIKWNICRICLNEERSDNPTMKSIFNESRLAKQIVDCAGIELSSNDGLPEKICRKCLVSLKSAVTFRNTCRKSDEHLRSVIQKAKQAANLEPVENTLAVEEIEELIEELDDGGDEYVYIIDVEDNKQKQTAVGGAVEAAEAPINKSTAITQTKNDIQVIKREKYNLIDLTRGDDGATRHDNSYSVELMPTDPLTTIAVEEDDDEEMIFSEVSNRGRKHSPSKNYAESENNTKSLDGFFSENEIYTVQETQEPKQVAHKLKQENSDLSYIKLRISNGSDEEYVLGEDEVEEEEEEEEYEDIETSDDGGKLLRVKSSADKSIIVKRAKYKSKDGSEDPCAVCFYCGNTFSSDQSLKLHIRNMHKGRTMECELCAKRFSSSSNLTAHMRIHTGERRYECKYCHRRFTDRSTHIKHERIHTNEKPFKCGICQKAFSLSTSLKAHERIHTGEKPFECKVCNKAFKLPHQLKAHLSTQLHKQAVIEGKDKKSDK